MRRAQPRRGSRAQREDPDQGERVSTGSCVLNLPETRRSAFVADFHLRSSGYNLITLGIVGAIVATFVFDAVRDEAPGFGRLWLPTLVALFGIAAAPVHARRAHKILGPLSTPRRRPFTEPFVRAWGPPAVMALVPTVSVTAAARFDWLVAIWLAALGLGYVRWGRGSGWRPYVILGVALLVGAGLSATAEVAAPGAGLSPTTVVAWYALIGLGCPAVGWWTNRVMVWGAPGAQ